MGLFSRFSKKKASDEELDRAAAAEEADEESSIRGTAVDDSVAEEDDDAEVDAGSSADEDDEDDDEALLRKSAPFDRAEKGPFDASEDYPELNRLDLGALKVPVVDGMQVRLDTDDSQRVLAVTLIHDGGGVQLQAFATPRSEGLWNTVRRQLATGIADQGGETSELHTALGKELSALVPAKTEDGRPTKRAMRFAGVDGPRWFVRAVFSGKAVTEDEVRAELSALVRGVVVDRGNEAMAPRELIVLTPPQVDPAEESEDDSDEDLNPFERGPEITEIR
ncbi:DUF3710 domain-containing protein [Brevibacterium sp.]|uniref:DUF3710 domain-containing protein n=1 Tax=Brevibacterium sp. TaxID=1701 RepID=UPI0028127D93|nr:DUF3710 domain-containing protein [Brevibacterium sp.]